MCAINITDCLFEAHKKYIDFQFVLEGEEYISYSNQDALIEVKEYAPEEDIILLKGKDNPIHVSSGMFYILFPEDAHKGCCHITR